MRQGFQRTMCCLIVASGRICAAQDNLIDVSVIMTAPAQTSSKGSIEGKFRKAIENLKINPEPKLSVERISSYSDYLLIRRLIEDPGRVLTGENEPVVYYVDDRPAAGDANIYIVRESDPAKHVTGIAVQVQSPEGVEIKQWNVEAAEVERAVFRAKSPSAAEFEFIPDPPDLDLRGYQLLCDNQLPTASWLRWPGRRARFNVDIRGFPGDPETYRALKKQLETATNRVSFTGESTNTISIADLEYKSNKINTELVAANGLIQYDTAAGDADRGWILLPLTPARRDDVLKEFREGFAQDKLSEFEMANILRGNKPLAKYPVVPAKQNQGLDGKRGPCWFELEKSIDGFHLQLNVSHENEWRRQFMEPGKPAPAHAYGLLVLEKDNQLIQFADGFWTVMSINEWNGGATKK